MARIRIAKASSGAAFVSKKKAAEARLAAQESGIELDDTYREEDIFELQHHHLLRCLEKTTVTFIIYFILFCWCCGFLLITSIVINIEFCISIWIYLHRTGSWICRIRNSIQWSTKKTGLTITASKSNAFHKQYNGLNTIVLWTMLLAKISGMMEAPILAFQQTFVLIPFFFFRCYCWFELATLACNSLISLLQTPICKLFLNLSILFTLCTPPSSHI